MSRLDVIINAQRKESTIARYNADDPNMYERCVAGEIDNGSLCTRGFCKQEPEIAECYFNSKESLNRLERELCPD